MLWRLQWDFGEVTLKFDISIVNINYVVLCNILRPHLSKVNGFFSVAKLSKIY